MSGRAGASVFTVAILTAPWSHAASAGVAETWRDCAFRPDWFALVPASYDGHPVGAIPSWAIGRMATNREGDMVYVWMVDRDAQKAAQKAAVAAGKVA